MNATGRATPPLARDGSSGVKLRTRLLLPIELAAILAIFMFDRYLPVSKTPYLFVLGWISLRLRGMGWRNVGFGRPRKWLSAVGLGILSGIGMEMLELFVTQPLLIHLTGRKPDFSKFLVLHGNGKVLILGFALAWTLAAFGEEMVWRGYLMNRVARLIRWPRVDWVVSLIVVNAGFGMAHRSQGITGVIDEALMGVILGFIYLASRRNLTSAILAHGVADSIDVFLLFLGHYPGT